MESFAYLVKVTLGVERGAEGGEDDEEVEEGEKEVFADEGHFYVALRDHALEGGEPCRYVSRFPWKGN